MFHGIEWATEVQTRRIQLYLTQETASFRIGISAPSLRQAERGFAGYEVKRKIDRWLRLTKKRLERRRS